MDRILEIVANSRSATARFKQTATTPTTSVCPSLPLPVHHDVLQNNNTTTSIGNEEIRSKHISSSKSPAPATSATSPSSSPVSPAYTTNTTLAIALEQEGAALSSQVQNINSPSDDLASKYNSESHPSPVAVSSPISSPQHTFEKENDNAKSSASLAPPAAGQTSTMQATSQQDIFNTRFILISAALAVGVAVVWAYFRHK